jgi:acyl carrier protein
MISEKLKEIVRHEFDAEGIDLNDDTMATDVPGWDSFSHISIIHRVEKEFGIRFKPLEIISLKNLGDLQAFIERSASK